MDEKQIIQEIIDLEDEQIEDFIKRRIEKLETNLTEDREELSPFTIMRSRMMGVRENPEVMGYISRSTHISKSGVDVASFTLDDTSFYKTMINYIRNAKVDNVKQGDRVNNNYIMLMVQMAIVNYFGLEADEISRNSLYDSKMDMENDDCMLSISDFKNNHTGMCVERSAVAQNILAFLGYNPMMVYGYASNQRDGINVGHAFNCIIRNGKGMIIDFSNPIYINGKVLKPAIFPINQENLQAFIEGKGNIEVQRKDIKQENGVENEDTTTWVYSSEEIDSRYFERKAKNENSVVNPNLITQDTNSIGLQEINSVMKETRNVVETKDIQKNEQHK